MDKTNTIIKIKSEIERRRKFLIERSYDLSVDMSSVERTRIQSILDNRESPSRPADIITLMKQFCTSAFSYAPLRRYLASFINDLPLRDTIDTALSRAFSNSAFLDDSNWTPEGLGRLALCIQKNEKYDLSRKQFNPRIISVLITGSVKLSNELKNGLDCFYNNISEVTTPAEMWELVLDFSRPIRNVGTALVCDFFKEMGFVRYVKVDHHFRKELPELVSGYAKCNQNPKESFILSQQIADSVVITPFHLDSILYLWGRYGRK